MNPFHRIFSLFRRKPGMVGTPPSARPRWHDPVEHALDFSRRYAEPADYHVGNRMTELGMSFDRIGMPDVKMGIRHAAFHPHGKDGGGVAPDGRIIVDSGLFNTEFLKVDYGGEAATLFARSRLRDRMDSIIAHEYEEHRHGMSHVEALKAAPGTDLPITGRAREILRAMERGWSR